MPLARAAPSAAPGPTAWMHPPWLATCSPSRPREASNLLAPAAARYSLQRGTLPGAMSAGSALLPADMAPGKVPRWSEYRAAAGASRFDASLGLLGEQVASHGGCIQAVGPGAALDVSYTHL